MPDTGRNAIACRDAIVTAIKALDLIADDQVRARRRPWNENQMLSGITVWLEEEKTAPSGVSSDEIGYGIGITFARRNSDSLSDADTTSKWRERVRRALLYQDISPTLEDNSTFCTMTFEHGNLNVPKLSETWEVHHLVVRCWVNEVRQ